MQECFFFWGGWEIFHGRIGRGRDGRFWVLGCTLGPFGFYSFCRLDCRAKSIYQKLNMLSVFSPVVWGSFLELEVPITCTIHQSIPHFTHPQENHKMLLTHQTYRPV